MSSHVVNAQGVAEKLFHLPTFQTESYRIRSSLMGQRAPDSLDKSLARCGRYPTTHQRQLDDI
eukprot:SAG11_NODE_17858_length_507_cov_0.845588_1_plen_63_part_00